MTLLTAGALTNHQLPETASNVCTTDARLGGVGRVPPPNKNPGYAGDHAMLFGFRSGVTLPELLKMFSYLCLERF